MISKAAKVFLLVDLLVVFICLLFWEISWLINTQFAFVSSVLVTLGSYLGYKKNIHSRIQEHQNDDDNYDELDKMDDKYDLYSPEVEKIEVEEASKEEIKEAMKPIKQNYFANFKSGISGMASLYRFGGYLFLVVGFFYLNNNNQLHIISYILGFLIVPISSLVLSFLMKKEYLNDSSQF